VDGVDICSGFVQGQAAQGLLASSGRGAPGALKEQHHRRDLNSIYSGDDDEAFQDYLENILHAGQGCSADDLNPTDSEDDEQRSSGQAHTVREMGLLLAMALEVLLPANLMSRRGCPQAFVRAVGVEVGTQLDGAYLDNSESSGSGCRDSSGVGEDVEAVHGPGPPAMQQEEDGYLLTAGGAAGQQLRGQALQQQQRDVVMVEHGGDDCLREVSKSVCAAQAFPYFTRVVDTDTKSGHGGGGGRFRRGKGGAQRKSVAQGALGGALAPGEKGHLKAQQKEVSS
jgi:hypothetical protein